MPRLCSKCNKGDACAHAQVANACVAVTSLKAAGCPGLTLNAVGGFPQLRVLDLSGCDCIAPATAVRFLLLPAHITSVFSGLRVCTRHARRMQVCGHAGLRVCTLHACPRVMPRRGLLSLEHARRSADCACARAAARQLPALERWTTLERLTLDHCGLLTHLTLSLPRLRAVSLRHCRALAAVRALPP
jgi:hypothetical protein